MFLTLTTVMAQCPTCKGGFPTFKDREPRLRARSMRLSPRVHGTARKWRRAVAPGRQAKGTPYHKKVDHARKRNPEPLCAVHRLRVLSLAVAIAALLGWAGCREPGAATAGKAPESHFIRGKVVGVNGSAVMLDHEAIPGFMAPMTMEYTLADPSVASELHPGDRITATLLNDRDAAGPIHLRLADIDVIAQARADYVPAVQYHVPAPGDAVPDFTLLNQSGKKIDLKQFRGKVLLMTFVYTRCPVADYCPKMSRSFAEIDHALASDPAAYSKTHLLTVSFDPEYDTPAVLRSYGGAYTGKYSQEPFHHWDFAAPSTAELPKMKQWFDVGVTPGPQRALQHSLSTLVIGADGKVVAFYPTNEWTVPQVLDVVRKAASA